MKRRLVVLPRAELDLLKHCVYLAEREPRLAERLKRLVRDFISGIGSSPRTGATLGLASFADIELRFRRPRGFKSYLIVYQVTDDSIRVLRVLHGSQDIEAALRPP